MFRFQDDERHEQSFLSSLREQNPEEAGGDGERGWQHADAFLQKPQSVEPQRAPGETRRFITSKMTLRSHLQRKSFFQTASVLPESGLNVLNMTAAVLCFSTRCLCLRGGNTLPTPSWWRTSASPSRGSPGRLARRPMSSTRTTWPERHRSVRTTSTAEPPTCRSETASVAAAGGGPTPTPPAGSSSRRSKDGEHASCLN